MAATNKSYQDAKWRQKFEELKEFQSETQKLYPNPGDNWNPLYNWVKNQRRLFRQGKLPVERKRLLDSVNFPWKTDNMSFDERVSQLIKYKKTHSTMHVSQVAYEKDSEYHRLSRWINEMRRLYNENRLPMDRIEKLNSIGFIWNMEDEHFAENLSRLKRFQKKYGHFDVPQSGRYKKLGSWVAQVRSRGLVKKHHIQALNEIGFVWEGKYKRLKKARDTMKEVDFVNYIKKPKKVKVDA